MTRRLPPQLNLGEVCNMALLQAHNALTELGSEGRESVSHDRLVDLTTQGDFGVAQRVIDFLRERHVPAIVYDEERGIVKLADNPRYTIPLDDIDGTNNYKRGRSPYCTAIAICDGLEPRFRDVLVAGIIEHTSGDVWFARKGDGAWLNGKPMKTSGMTQIQTPVEGGKLYRANVTVDMYLDGDAFPEIIDSVWPADFCSGAYHLAGVSSGIFDAHITRNRKVDELAAGYLLVKEAGGFVSDLEGKPIDDVRIRPDTKYPIVAAATEPLARALLTMIR